MTWEGRRHPTGPRATPASPGQYAASALQPPCAAPGLGLPQTFISFPFPPSPAHPALFDCHFPSLLVSLPHLAKGFCLYLTFSVPSPTPDTLSSRFFLSFCVVVSQWLSFTRTGAQEVGVLGSAGEHDPADSPDGLAAPAPLPFAFATPKA